VNLLAQISLVLKGLLSRKGRSFLTILGIVIGVAGVIIIIALGAGAPNILRGRAACAPLIDALRRRIPTAFSNFDYAAAEARAWLDRGRGSAARTHVNPPEEP